MHHSGPSPTMHRTLARVLALLLCHLLAAGSLFSSGHSAQAFRLSHSWGSAEAHTLENEKRLNITHDLMLDTAPTAFNLSDWTCLDRFLAGEDDHPYELESNFTRLRTKTNASSPSCKCSINAQCLKSHSSPPTSQMTFWFRCYELTDLQPLQSFVESLSTERLLKKVLERERAQVLAACSQSDPKIITVRADLVRSNLSANSVFQFADQLNSLTNVQLESVSIRECSLQSIPPSLMAGWKHLKSLNLTRNQLVEFNSRQLYSTESNAQLAVLDLSHNKLSRVDLSQLVSLRSIDLSHNKLTTLSTSDLSEQLMKLLQSLQHRKSLVDFNLANNPWDCNSRLSWLVNLFTAIVDANGHIFESEHQLELFKTTEPECAEPQAAKRFPFSVWKSVQEVAICSKCDCGLEEKYAEVGYRYVIVNCTDKNLDYLPTDLPKNSKIIDLSNNRIRKLSTNWPKLSMWRHVNKVILQNNSLQSIDGLDKVHSIVYLDISGNFFTEIPYHILDRALSARQMDKMRIGNNPFTCDCDTVRLQKWLQNYYRIILDIGNVRCGYMRSELTKNESNIAAQAYNARFHNREVFKITNLELCPSSGSVEFFDIINCVLALIIVVLVSKVTYDYFWQKRTGKLPRFFKVNI